jgi:rhomboid family protein
LYHLPSRPTLRVMGIYDRDYYRRSHPRGGFGHFAMWSVTTWLIVINVAVFLLDRILAAHFAYYRIEVWRDTLVRRIIPPLDYWGSFTIQDGIERFQLWRLITCQFLHANFQHLFWNMLGLFFFGQIAESYFGRPRYLAFYLLCGCAGALFYAVLGWSGLLETTRTTSLVGASAGIYGTLVASAVIAPNVTVMLLFPPIPIQLKWMAIFMMGVAVYTAVSNGVNAGGEAAHVGGGLLGYVFTRYPQVLNPFQGAGRARARMRFRDWSKDLNH